MIITGKNGLCCYFLVMKHLSKINVGIETTMTSSSFLKMEYTCKF